MARIAPLGENELKPSVKIAFERHIEQYQGSITNTKGTLGHSLLAFETYMHWYPLYEETERILGKRLAYFYAYSICKAAECQLCTAFFRKVIIDAGERPETVKLTESQRSVVELGASIAKYQGNIANRVYDAVAKNYTRSEIVVLIAFAGQMIAMNVFNNVIETDIDDHLVDYLPVINYH